MIRICVASIAGIAGFVAYVAAVVALADRLREMNWAAAALYFAVTGVIWVLPARWLMYWAAGGR